MHLIKSIIHVNFVLRALYSDISLLASAYFGTFRALLFNFLNNFVWLRITDEGSVCEMRIWSILLIKYKLYWSMYISKSEFLYCIMKRYSPRCTCKPYHKNSFDFYMKFNVFAFSVTMFLSFQGIPIDDDKSNSEDNVDARRDQIDQRWTTQRIYWWAPPSPRTRGCRAPTALGMMETSWPTSQSTCPPCLATWPRPLQLPPLSRARLTSSGSCATII